MIGIPSPTARGPHARHREVKYVAVTSMRAALLLGRDAVGRVAAPEGGTGGCRKVRKIIDGTMDAIDC